MTDGALRPLGEVVVGLEPVAVRARSDSEVFVSNRLSDSVSVVDCSRPERPFVRATLNVGDEPQDLALAGPARELLVVATSRLGQNRPAGPGVSPPSPGLGELWVFDTRRLEAPPGLLALPCPPAYTLAVSPDGLTLYAAPLLSGNRTVVLPPRMRPGGPERPRSGPGEGLPVAPRTGRLAHAKGDRWVTAEGEDVSGEVKEWAEDVDLVTVSFAGAAPGIVRQTNGVGTVILGLAVGPGDGTVYATNLEARSFIPHEPALRGQPVDNRLTIVPAEGSAEGVRAISLNSHIQRAPPEGTLEELASSFAIPVGLAARRDGQRLYFCALASGLVGVLDSRGRVLERLQVGGNPTGLALHEDARRLFVYERFLHLILVYDLDRGTLLESVPLGYNPEPERWRRGRQYLYDARSSAHGDAACGSCHIFGHTDGLAWDLGDPDGAVEPNPLHPVPVAGIPPLAAFHPLKGPMRTQSLRGLSGTGPLHWRGDKHGGPDALDDSGAAFLQFRASFETLLGRQGEFPLPEMEKLRDFVLSIRYPPSPVAPLDGSLTAAQERGRRLFSTPRVGADGKTRAPACVACHLPPTGTGGHALQASQCFKVPHLRGLHERRGGLTHDGTVPSLERLLQVHPLELLPGTPEEARSPDQISDLVEHLLAYPTGLAPAVGQQVTLSSSSTPAARERFRLLEARARAGDGDLVLHGMVAGEARGWLLELDGNGSASYPSNRAGEVLSPGALLELLARPGVVLTATLAPPGSGRRRALDRDEDGSLDRDDPETARRD